MLHEFTRTEMLIGTEGLKKLKNSKIAVFGIGGVGTFVVEGLVRSGVGKFVLIDNDEITLTNINRQIHSNHKTIGISKVEAMKERMLDINPNVEVATFNKLYNAESSEELIKDDYDYVVDAIDMVSSKLDLIEKCYNRDIRIISSMGAGNKLNPTLLEVDDIYKTSVCPLARVIRKELRNRRVDKLNPTLLEVDDIYKTSVCPLARVIRKELRSRNVDKLKVVYSKEKPISPVPLEESSNRRHLPGSVSFVPSVAGLIIASEVIKDLINN